MRKLLAILLVLCMFCALVVPVYAEGEEISPLSKWADHLYEPDTSITLPATIVWPATENAIEVATADVRPNTMIVAIDENLNVYTLEGKPLSEDLASYLIAVKDTTLAALYIRDQATADAFDAFAKDNAVADVFVVADSEHTDYVCQICDHNTGILGIVDWTDAGITTERASLLTVTQQTNAAHAKIAIIPEDIATRETVEYLRCMLTTVWVATSPDAASIFLQITNGVNGICTTDYAAVAAALESVNDVTTLMRHVGITGHRGLPCQYVENTIRSERAAIEVGANTIECDVSMSSDGVIFVLHDDGAKRLFNREDIESVEDYTIAELQAMPYDMTDDTPENAPNSVLNTNHTNRNTPRREDTVLNYDPESDHIPTLREYFEALGDEDIFHFVEIKSYNPQIVKVLRELAEEMGMTDRMCIITFNDGRISAAGFVPFDPEHDVLNAMREEWPEMSLGYLHYGSYTLGDLNALVDEQGIGAGVGALYAYLQPYNATYNDCNAVMFKDIIFAARHRGLTSWAWTYNDEEIFATDYLLGGTYSLTTNFSNWASDLPVRIDVSDVSLESGEILPVQVISQKGDVLENPGELSLVSIDGIPVSLDENGAIIAEESGEALVMVRLDTTLNINNFDLSDVVDTDYAIYSNPITITIAK